VTGEWVTLTESLRRLEEEDPVVAKAARECDEAVTRLNERAALHRFRPLPWDRR
jgi:hypothetical protein